MSFKSKVIVFILSISIIISSFALITFAETTVVMGDIYNDSVFNSVDLAVFRRYFLGTYKNISSTAADTNLDNVIDIRDLVRLKKYQAGDVLHNYSANVGASWVVMRDSDGVGFPVVVGYRLNINCYTKTVCLPGRYTSEISGYVSTEKNPNPEFELPELSVSTTKINEITIDMQDAISWVSPTWIYDCKVSYSKINVPTLSSYDCLIIAMMKEAIYPYFQKEIVFTF